MPKSKFPRPMSGKMMQGILKKPIDEPDGLMVALLAHGCPADAQQEMYRLSNEYVNEQRAARVTALAEHYGAKADDDLAAFLLLRLAEDFVVGFRKNVPEIRVTSGRRKGPTNDDDTFSLMVAATDLLRKKHSKKRACEILTTRRKSAWYGKSAKGLLERLNRYIKYRTDLLEHSYTDTDTNKTETKLRLREDLDSQLASYAKTATRKQCKGLMKKERNKMTTTFRDKSRPTKVLSKYANTGWSAERRFIQAIAIQRWRPWEHSTGPRTTRGKEQAALNAYNAYLSRLPMDKLLAAIKRK